MAAEVMPSRKKPALQHHHHHNANGQVSSGHQKSLGDEAEREVGALPKLQRCPTAGHKPDKYDDLEDLEYPPALYSGMEQYLPGDLLSASRDKKISFLERILAKYRPNGERARVRSSSTLLITTPCCTSIFAHASVQ